jgi:hypothetical protein
MDNDHVKRDKLYQRDEKMEGLEIQLEQRDFTIVQLDLALVLEREKVAEAQADNATLVRASWGFGGYAKEAKQTNTPEYMEGYWERLAAYEKTVTADHPGASLLAELAQLRKIASIAKDIQINIHNIFCEPPGLRYDQLRKQTLSFNKRLGNALAQAKAAKR